MKILRKNSSFPMRILVCVCVAKSTQGGDTAMLDYMRALHKRFFQEAECLDLRKQAEKL